MTSVSLTTRINAHSNKFATITYYKPITSFEQKVDLDNQVVGQTAPNRHTLWINLRYNFHPTLMSFINAFNNRDKMKDVSLCPESAFYVNLKANNALKENW